MNIKKLLHCILPLLLLAAAQGSAQACAVCFGAPGSRETDAISWAILFLLGLLLMVLGGIVAGAVSVVRRANRYAAAHGEDQAFGSTASY